MVKKVHTPGGLYQWCTNGYPSQFHQGRAGQRRLNFWDSLGCIGAPRPCAATALHVLAHSGVAVALVGSVVGTGVSCLGVETGIGMVGCAAGIAGTPAACGGGGGGSGGSSSYGGGGGGSYDGGSSYDSGGSSSYE